MARILVAERLESEGVELLRAAGEVEERVGLDAQELLDRIEQFDALIVRSRTQVTADVVEAGNRLQVIGRAGVGVDNIDLEAATRKGIAVVNAPTGNTVAAAEHTIALVLALARNIPQANQSVRRREWDRGAFVGVELRDKTMGIVGLGRVGVEVARTAVALKMRVLAYDPFVSQEQASRLDVQLMPIDGVLRESDFVSLHTPLTESTRGLIGHQELSAIKPGSRIINAARGELIDEDALLQALDEGRVAGAALDVLSAEPPGDSPLLDHERVIVTPHLGASTKEAQAGVAREVAEQVLAVLGGQPARHTVNAPSIAPETHDVLAPYVEVALYAGSLATQLADGQLMAVGLRYEGEIAGYDTDVLKAACIMGLLRPVSSDRVNLVNAVHIASERGLKVSERAEPRTEHYGSMITVEVETSEGKTIISGTHMRSEPHIVRVGNYWVDIVPTRAHLLFTDHHDSPGIIGAVGAIMGKHDVNIAFMQVGRLEARGRATMILGLDEPVPPAALDDIGQIPNVFQAKAVQL